MVNKVLSGEKVDRSWRIQNCVTYLAMRRLWPHDRNHMVTQNLTD